MRVFGKIIITLFLLSLCLGSSALAADSPKLLRIAVNGPYIPFAYENADGSLGGFDVDIAGAICKELGYECEITNVPFDDIIPGIMAGTIDLSVAGMGPTDQRKTLVDFTDRYYRSLSIYIEREGAFAEVTPESVKGKRLGAQADTLQAEHLKQAFGKTSTIVTVASHDDVFVLLEKGEVDLVLVDGLPGYTFLKSDAGVGFDAVGAPLEPNGDKGWACIAVSKDKPALREAVNKAILNLRRSGEYGKINRNYFDFNVY